MTSIDLLFEHLAEHDAKFRRSVSLIPSENAISPLSRLAFLSDAYSRYFFDEHEAFGRWSFQGGSIAGRIQQEVLVPTMQRLGKASFVDVRCVSGLTAMTTAIAAFGGAAGEVMLSVPVANGGHPDTAYVADRFGLRTLGVPFRDWATIDLAALADLVAAERPRLVYLDHATTLFPLDLTEVVRTIRQASTRPVHIHVDTSHVNGLIWGGVMDNPLECGADSYGGSTHKTFPGPHKAVLFTNDAAVSDQLTGAAVNMISHQHLSDVIALAIAAVEFVECGGREYAAAVLANARTFAAALDREGLAVQGHDGEFTRNHQVWLDTAAGPDPHELSTRLFEAGIVVNPYNPLPSLGRAGVRMGVNEATRMGLSSDGIDVLASVIGRMAREGAAPKTVAAQVRELREGMSPRYCYGPEVLEAKLAALVSPGADAESLLPKQLREFLYS
ncbi:hypothetical protein [Catellatospora sp. NPDC049609]|uniref:hypothetical protein n=1 Tax=Catellatospora sp. NPDC049609 TaxID=3155505 RepID=UPI00343D8BEC